MIIENSTIYDNFIQIVEHYLDNFSKYQFGNKYSYNCTFGSIEFYKCINDNKIIVHEIYVLEQYRKKVYAKIL